MKILLSLLISIVLLQSQVFALSGGPNYNQGGGAIANIIGTYGGVMVEQSDPVDDSNGGSVAVYTMEIVQSGTSTGTLLVFNAGRIYPGTITGIGDSTSGSSAFKGLIEAQYTYGITSFVTNPVTGVTTTIITGVTATTNGTINTTIDTVRNGATSNLLMTGTANLEVSNGIVDNDGNFVIEREVGYDVSGYRQAVPAA